MSAQRPVWSFFVPTTGASKMRKLSVAAPLILFGLSCDAVLSKQGYFRGQLADEEQTVADRIHRRGYVALPDGQMALVHPRINTDFSLRGVLRSFVEFVNPMP